jgi:hypothetical protein
MTIRDPVADYTFADLVEDEWRILWLHEPDRRGRLKAKYLLTAVLGLGWRILDATPAERAMLADHGFASGRLQ